MERLKKAILLVASSLLFAFPVYAEELEASELPIEEVSHDVELINDSTKEASEVSIDNLAEIQGGMVKAPSINPNVNFKYLGLNIEGGDDNSNVSVIFEGEIPVSGNPSGIMSFRINTNDGGFVAARPNYSVDIPNGRTITDVVLFNNLSGIVSTLGTYNILLDGSSVNTDGVENVGITSYLSFVGTVFTWLLTTIGVLITFILGNPFLAVSLLLFMAGTVISFYIRIKNS